MIDQWPQEFLLLFPSVRVQSPQLPSSHCISDRQHLGSFWEDGVSATGIRTCVCIYRTPAHHTPPHPTPFLRVLCHTISGKRLSAGCLMSNVLLGHKTGENEVRARLSVTCLRFVMLWLSHA